MYILSSIRQMMEFVSIAFDMTMWWRVHLGPLDREPGLLGALVRRELNESA